MAVATNSHDRRSETTHSTKRVFMRAEHGDKIEISDTVSNSSDESIPKTATVVKRDTTYYGPKLRIEDEDCCGQFLLTAPGPETEAVLWRLTDSDWQGIAEVCLRFADDLPKYDICPHCNEPLSTIAHRRRSVIGVCMNR